MGNADILKFRRRKAQFGRLSERQHKDFLLVQCSFFGLPYTGMGRMRRAATVESSLKIAACFVLNFIY